MIVATSSDERRIIEVQVLEDKIVVFERSGDGQIRQLILTLSGYGLSLEEEFCSPCG
jgi:hypothetical protein